MVSNPTTPLRQSLVPSSSALFSGAQALQRSAPLPDVRVIGGEMLQGGAMQQAGSQLSGEVAVIGSTPSVRAGDDTIVTRSINSLDETLAAPLLLMKPENDSELEDIPCEPPWVFWPLFFALFEVMLRSRFLKDRDNAARRIAELAVQCPQHNLERLLANVQTKDERLRHYLDWMIDYWVNGHIWDCEHALEVMRNEISRTPPNADRFNHAEAYVWNPDHDCTTERNFISRGGGARRIGLSGNETEQDLVRIADSLGVDRRIY